MTITAKFPGKCSECGQRIAPGDRIDWDKAAKTVRHENCAAAGAEAETTTGYAPTVEQEKALALFATGRSLAIEAGAGTGKTSTLVMLAKAAPTRRGQYIAFNRSIVAEAATKFPRNVTCKTAHSLAYRAIGHRYSHRLDSNRMKTTEIAARLGVNAIRFETAGITGEPKILSDVQLAKLTMKAVEAFCQSADEQPQAIHVPFVRGLDRPGEFSNNNEVSRYLLPFVRKAWADLQDENGALRFSPAHYLKMWQLSGPRIAADFILFDEAQDANPVMVAIVAAQTHAQLVWVGDSQQQIYTFTGAVNALKTVPADDRAFLTQSFRFGAEIAAVANVCLAELQAELEISGWDQVDSTVGPIAEPDAILCRTNAEAVRCVLNALADGRRPHLVGGGEAVVRFAKAARDLMEGRGTDHPELACFDSWDEVKLYVDEEEADDLKLLVKLITDFGIDRIISALDRQPEERDADVVVSTAHKAKGREWDAVQLAGDFPDQAQGEELRLLYVACTRARIELDIDAVAALA